MAFRDDGDAARHRADALQRELDETKQALAVSDEESEQLRDELEGAEKELEKHKKRAAKAEGALAPENKSYLWVWVAVFALGVAGLAALFAVRGEKKAKGPTLHTTERFAADYKLDPKASYIDGAYKFMVLRFCLNRTDQRGHHLAAWYRTLSKKVERRDLSMMAQHGAEDDAVRCRAFLANLEHEAPKLSGADALIPPYREVVKRWTDLGFGAYEPDKYTETRAILQEFEKASLALRQALHPHLAAFASRDIKHASRMGTRTAVLATPLWHALNVLFDALVLYKNDVMKVAALSAAVDVLRGRLSERESKDPKAIAFRIDVDAVLRALSGLRVAEGRKKPRQIAYERQRLIGAFRKADASYFGGYLIPEGWYSRLHGPR